MQRIPRVNRPCTNDCLPRLTTLKPRTLIRAIGLAVVFVAFGCTEEPSEYAPATIPATDEGTGVTDGQTPRPTIVPTPGQTQTPADVFATPASTAVPSTFFEFGNLVPPDDRALIEAGVSIAQRYLDAAVGINEPRVTVYAYADLQGVDAPWESIASQSGIPPDALVQGLNVFVGETFPEAIFINVASPRWKDLPTLERIRLAAHEYVHAIQLDLMGAGKTRRFFNSVGQTETTAGPLWLIEGSAEYLSWLALQSTGLLSLDRFLETTTAKRVAPRQMSSFGAFQIEGPAAYVSGLRAVIYLAGAGGEERVLDYFETLGLGESWEVAFRDTFGRDIESFYRDYDAQDGR